MKLEQLGNRISIIGPSNSGKSTLAQYLGAKLLLPVYHLDQFAHVPGTNWSPRPNKEWKIEHDEFIKQTNWIIEGNYSFCMPQRFARSTIIIWLDFNVWGCLVRYLKRFLSNDYARPGRLANAKQEFSLRLIIYILFTYPKKRNRTQMLVEKSGTSVLRIYSMNELNQYFQQ